MIDLRISKLRRHYRLPSNNNEERSRVDRVLQLALEDELFDAALRRAGVSSDDQICIRRVNAAFKFNNVHQDVMLAASWSVALADAIAMEINQCGANVLRYASRRQALVDMALCIARGDVTRAWAWRKLELWNAGDFVSVAEARGELIDVLARNAESALPVLSIVARSGWLSTLMVDVPIARWEELVRAVLVAFNETALATSLVSNGHSKLATNNEVEVNDANSAHHARISLIIERFAQQSEIVRALTNTSFSISERLRVVIAWLTVLEVEPTALRNRPHTLVERLAQRVLANQSAKHDTPVRSRPAAPLNAERTEHEERIDQRIRAVTNNGGLLFLLSIVRSLDLPTAILAVPEFSARTFRWTMHQLALALLETDGSAGYDNAGDDNAGYGDAGCNSAGYDNADGDSAGRGNTGYRRANYDNAGPDNTGYDTDAAALAFTGLAPNATAPSFEQPAISRGEHEALQAIRSAICKALRERGAALPGERDPAMLRRIIQRRAEIIADVAWIEAHFALADVCTEIRRAALDLDPGWMPWLGVVLRFVYA